jgi:flagellar export protein FliJ
MKRFEFTLLRVRDFRRQQLEVEEARLQALAVERTALDAMAERLRNETSQIRQSLMVTESAEAQELVAADRYLRGLQQTAKRHADKMADCQARIQKQRERMVEARRRVRLMEKLEAKQLGAWKAAADREQENLSSELYLARWNR